MLIRLVLVKLLTRPPRIDTGDEVLDDLDSLLFFEYEIVDVRGRMVARQKLTKLRMRDSKNLGKTLKLVRCHPFVCVSWARRPWTPEGVTGACNSVAKHQSVHELLVEAFGDLLAVIEQDLLHLALSHGRTGAPAMHGGVVSRQCAEPSLHVVHL